MVSQRIDRYEIKTELGRGGMATVYHAYDPRFGRDVAIKVLPREFLHEPTFQARFEREARTIATLEHPAIVPVYDFGEEGGQPYLVMRYMAGGSLADRIGQGALPLDETAHIVVRLAPALDKAHERGIVHRDLKPSNILFDEDGNPYLSDFGIVKVTEATAQLTGSGIVGTPAYMAPEMADRGGTSPLIDIYALGVTLFQMLTGRLPYEADTPMGTLMAHISKPIPDVRDLRADLPADVQTVVERVMAKDPHDRYQSAGALAADLQAAIMMEEPGHGRTVLTETMPVAPALEPIRQQPPVEPSPHRRSPVWLTIIGWAIAWAIAGLLVGASGAPGEAACIALALGGAIGGLFTGLSLRRAKPALQWKHILMIVGGWIVGGAFALWLIGGAFGGLITGVVLRRIEPTIRWKQVLMIALGWAIGGAVGLAAVLITANIIHMLVAGVIGGAINGAIGGAMMHRQYSPRS